MHPFRKGAAAEQSLRRAEQQEKAHAMAWENNPASVLQSACSRGRGGQGLAILRKLNCLTKGKDIKFEELGGEEKTQQLLHFQLLLLTDCEGYLAS